MSFILDALKKSESDRQRQNGPALFEVKVAPRRAGLPPWAIAIALLLGVNLLIVLWMVLRHPPAHADAPLATAAPATLVPATVAAAPAPQAVPVPMPQVATASAITAAALAPSPVNAPLPAAAPSPAAGAGSVPPNDPDPQDLVPAREAPALAGSHVTRGTAEGVQLYQDAAAAPGNHIPPLRLDLHVYGATPAERFVMINMKKLREGDSLPEGVRVESITPEGAVLSYAGGRFLLPRD